MKRIDYPAPESWEQLLARPTFDARTLFELVSGVERDVRRDGDEALRHYEQKFDHATLTSLEVSQAEIDAAEKELSQELREAIVLAHGTISRFHEAQRFAPISVNTARGVECRQKAVPIERVGLYVPGGTAPLFSTVLMLATPARIAGCHDIVLCTPPAPDGHVHPAILFAARTAGVHRLFKLGGSQAIVAMAVGTESVPKVDKIFGPGNQYVMAAKQWVSLGDVAIDMPAGPSEVEVVADDTANPAFVAADLLSQAEHGADSQVVLVTTSADMCDRVMAEVEEQKRTLPRLEIVNKSLEHSLFIVVRDLDEAVALTNAYAPEHLVVATEHYEDFAARITHAGSIFLGPYSCESAGDYASGTNHTLPTKGYARAYSGLNLDSFCRKMTLQHLTAEGVRQIGPAVEVMARGEQLEAHCRAMSIRLRAIEASKR